MIATVETLLEYEQPLVDEQGNAYRARACGCVREDGKWEGWFELQAVDTDDVFETERETTQPNRKDLEYWATGISHVYLEGALRRAMEHATH